MATPKKTKNGYTAHVYLGMKDGKKKYKSITAPTLRQWKMKEAQAKMDFDKHTSDGENPTIDEAIESYIEERSHVVSEATIRGYDVIRRHYVSDIAAERVRDVDNRALQLWVNDLAAEYASKTVSNAIGLVLAAISAYCPEKRFKITRPQKDVVEYNTPDDKDVDSLMEAAEPELEKCICLAAFGTLRRSEICALTYADILRDMSAVYVHSAMIMDRHGQWVIKERPKNNSSVRHVIYPEEIIKMLGTGEPNERIIKYDPGYLSKRFTHLKQRLGMKCTFHELRHYAASLMHAIGIPDQYILERGGWKTDHTLKTVYRNTLKDKNHQFTQMTNAYFEEHFSRKSG